MNLDLARLKRISTLAEHQVKSGAFSNIEWQVAYKNDLVDSGSIGYADALSHITLPADPIYRIYSMTKPVISVLAMMLIEEGDLALPAAVADYLPMAADITVQTAADGSSKPANNPMLIEHLFTHRAGLSYDFLPECGIADLYRQQRLAEDGSLTLAELVEKLLATPLCFEPGSQWRYSYSIDVLAHILEVVAGQPIEQLLQSRIFDPCGMRDTAFCVAADSLDRLLPMFGQRELGEKMSVITGAQTLKPMNIEQSHPVNSPSFTRGGHGLYSTASDYMKFMQVLDNGKTPDGQTLLSAPMCKLMWSNRLPDSHLPMCIGPNTLSGYGWGLFGRVVKDLGQTLFLTGSSEGGWSGAACTYFWVDPELELRGVVMTQYLGATVPLGDYIRCAAYQALT